MTPTARTLNLLRRSGYIAAVVERWLPRVERRQDLFGFADVLAVHPQDRAFLLVQATSASNVASRLTKAKSKPELRDWLRAGGTFEVWGWFQRDGHWQVRRVAVQTDGLTTVELTPRPRRRRRAVQRSVRLTPERAIRLASGLASGVQNRPDGFRVTCDSSRRLMRSCAI